jgi:hypothetical protein
MNALKSLLSLLVLTLHLGGTAWLWAVEGWQSALAWGVLFPIMLGILLMAHDVIRRLLSPLWPASKAGSAE